MQVCICQPGLESKTIICVSGGGRKMWHEITPTLFTAMEVLPSALHANHFLFFSLKLSLSTHVTMVTLSFTPCKDTCLSCHMTPSQSIFRLCLPQWCQGQLLSFVHVVGTFNIVTVRTREMVQRLREDPGLVPSIHLVAHNHVSLNSHGSTTPF